MIDSRVSRWLQRIWFLRLNEDSKDFWRPVIERLILLLSDYQLLFGMAILTAGFWKRCSISVYHFSLVVDLAWFSNTHMTSLSVLKCYLQERKPLRNWRVYTMVVMMIMMLAAIVLASRKRWVYSLPCPAQCMFNESEVDLSHTYPYVVAVILHYTTSIWRVYDTTALDNYLLERPRETLRYIARHRKRQDSDLSRRSVVRFEKANIWIGFRQWSLVVLIHLYLGAASTLGSLTISLYYDIVWFALGFTGILYSRAIPSSDMIGNENTLNFGQIMSILMLASILITFKEVYTGMVHSPHERLRIAKAVFRAETQVASR